MSGEIKYYNGSAFEWKPIKVWNGSAWVTKPLKYWNGSEWVLTNDSILPETRLVFSVKTDNAGTSGTNQFTIPTNGSGYSYDIETSDGQTITGLTSGTTITFPSAGTYDVFITGAFPQFYFANGGDKLKLIEIKNFGTYAQGSTNQYAAFNGCSNLVISATDTGYFGNVTNFLYTWNNCSSLTSFPLIDTSSGNTFFATWRFCYSLTTFPANVFDSNISTNYTGAFQATNLSTQSIDNILVSLDVCGVSNGTFTQSGGSTPSATGLAAKTNLINKGWTITTT
jgi:hypothetical protein